MDDNRLKGKWMQIKGEAKKQWGKLTDDELNQIDGDRMKLEGMLREKYGYGKDRIKREIEDWLKKAS